MKLYSFLVVFFLVYSLTTATDDDVIGCGGFIKSNTEINYKIIKVKLVTKDGGAVKYVAEASPVNGYYMIPIYNKGEYVLQVAPPPGWSFEPSQVEINVDGVNDQCSKNQDISFHFKGFGLSGKVATEGDAKNQGPAGVKLNLLSNKNLVIDSAVTSQGGSYYFSNIMPGNYKIEVADQQSIGFYFKTKKVNVELSKENWFAKDNIVVSGYTLEGQVTASDKKQPVRDVQVDLLVVERGTNNFNKVSTKKSDQNGRFLFENVPYGKYRLTASLIQSNGAIEYHFLPEQLDADLTQHQNVKLEQGSFLLNAVTIKSKVLASEQVTFFKFLEFVLD
jgi:hypothetical protein